jgi:DHA2 family multidrug resistance protein
VAAEPLGEIKRWVPAWVTKIVIFMVLLPSMGLFGLSTANSNAAAGFYGFEPMDIQYSMIVFYAALTSFFALERRFFNHLAVKDYLLLGTIVQVASSYVCYKTHSLPILLAFRFIQGMANCTTSSICITLIFKQLKGERAREIGYSVIYGMLLSLSQISMMITSPVLESFDFNTLYKCIMFIFIPGTFFLYIILNNVRLIDKAHLYKLDWASFVIYSVALLLIGYVLIYGQHHYWLEDKRIVWSFVGIVLLLSLHVLRQLSLKRPYLSLEVFKYRNFKIGAFLIFVLYICRGTLNVTNSYFAVVIGMDPIHISYLLFANSAGILVSVFVASRLIITKTPMRYIWIVGFMFLLMFHIWMRFLFSSSGNMSTFLLPLFLQGLGAGTLITPIILYMVSSVPTHLGMVASATGVFFRFLGFCGSIAFANYYALVSKNTHYNRFQQHLSALDPAAMQKLAGYRQLFLSKGMAPDQATKMATSMLNRAVSVQSQMRYAVDYYELISWFLLGVILLIALFPYLNRTMINVKSNQPAPATF